MASRESLAQCPDGTPPPCGPSAPARASVAVLYFDNLSRDTADAYLAEGLTEELIARLTQVERLSIQSRNAVRRYRGTDPDPRTLGRALGVSYLVSGTVRRGGGRLRVGVSLVRTSTGVGVWAEQFDRTDADLLAIQEDIAREVTSRVAGRLLPSEREALAARPTQSAMAYDRFLRGNHLLALRTPQALAEAISAYSEALRADPSFAAAQARIAYAYAMGALVYGLEGAPSESLNALGTLAAERALALDPNASDAWMVVGWLEWSRPRYDSAAAMRAFERALRLDPRNAEAHHRYGMAFLLLGNDSAAQAECERSLVLEPARPVTLAELALLHQRNGRLAIAGRLADSALATDPGFARAYTVRAILRLQHRDSAGARRDAAAAMRLGTGALRIEAELALTVAQGAAGDTARLHTILLRFASHPIIWPYRSGQWLAALGLGDAALTALEMLPRLTCGQLQHPVFAAISQTPRFERLVAHACP